MGFKRKCLGFGLFVCLFNLNHLRILKPLTELNFLLSVFNSSSKTICLHKFRKRECFDQMECSVVR